MSSVGKAVDEILSALQERTKELNCLYAIEELTNDDHLPLEDVLRGVVAAVPSGWQYEDICRARITVDGRTCAPADFLETPWCLRAAICMQGQTVGALEVIYTDPMPPADHGPFLRGEQKLLEFIADRLASCITHRRLSEEMRQWRSARQQLARRSAEDWPAIVDLLRRTDRNLLDRIARKMINHLCWNGVVAPNLVLQRAGGDCPELLDGCGESNQPSPAGPARPGDEFVDEVFRIAAARVSDAEILACIQKWIKQDRASFLINVVENVNTTLAQVGDALQPLSLRAAGRNRAGPGGAEGACASR